jgi:uncharacterized protein DUF4907
MQTLTNGILMKPTTSKTKNINKLILPGIIIILGILFYTVYYSQLQTERGYALVELRPIQVSSGWGYEILANGKPYIRQQFIPAIEGHHSFKTKEDALTVGSRVIEKMKQGEQLPTISIEELNQMGVLKDSLP